jgi:acyl-CoA synthetase (AMP-forming)/AMP-acid ligase II
MGVPDRSLGEKVIIVFEKSLPSNYDKAINSLSTYEKPKSFLVLDKFSRNNNKLLRKEIINEVLSKWKTAQK